MKSNSIDRIMVGPNNPHNNNTLWIDTSNGEKNAVLKYKGNPLSGSGNSEPSNMVIEAVPMTQEEINLVTTSKGYITGGYKISINQLPVHIKIKYEDSENEYIYTTQCILNDSNNDLYGIITETSIGDFKTIYFLVPNDYASGDLVAYDSSALPEGFMYYIMLQ